MVYVEVAAVIFFSGNMREEVRPGVWAFTGAREECMGGEGRNRSKAADKDCGNEEAAAQLGSR